jgi:hypothetical protein
LLKLLLVFAEIVIITSVFEKNANFFAENWQKSQKIVIITSTPGDGTLSHRQMYNILGKYLPYRSHINLELLRCDKSNPANDCMYMAKSCLTLQTYLCRYYRLSNAVPRWTLSMLPDFILSNQKSLFG